MWNRFDNPEGSLWSRHVRVDLNIREAPCGVAGIIRDKTLPELSTYTQFETIFLVYFNKF